MKVNEYYVNPKNGEKVLDILKTSLKPETQPQLTLTKYRDPDKAAYKINYSTYVSKEEYKQLKEIAKGIDGVTIQERPIPEKLSLDKIFTEKALEILEEDARKGDPENLIYEVAATPDGSNLKLSLTVSTDAYLELASLAKSDRQAQQPQAAPSDEPNTENNKEDENEMEEILQKICEFQTLKEIRIPSDDIPVEDGVKRIVIKLKD
ncbi:hypothetical protein ACMZ7I_07140 [Gardnerella vaginalis]|uniref:hypothetical protein n=1 Tax=Gardnerella vaginalis TaxID=2702 RepID=UPI0039F0409F